MKKCDKMKVEEWSKPFVSLNCSLIAITFILGGYITFKSGILPFLGLIIIIFINFCAAFYTTCRHCYYHGRRCYLGIGLLVPLFFAKSSKPVNIIKEGIWLTIFAFNIIYPLIFLYISNTLSLTLILYTLIYLSLPATVVILVSKKCCPRCNNTGCAANPSKKG